MSRTTTALKRLGVPVIAAVTMVAGVPALVGTANANHVNGVTLTAGASAPAGACQTFTATYTSSNAATPTATIDVNLTPSSGDPSTVQFCNTTPDTTQASPRTNTVATGSNTRNGEFNDNDFSITFGVISTREQTVQVTAFAELNESGAAAGSPGAGVVNEGEPNATSTATFTVGGAPAVTVVDAEPETGFAVNGQRYTATATVRNAAGQPVPGVPVFLDVISGPDAATINGDRCASPTAVTDQRGQVACTFAGTNGPGTDTLRIYVNKANGDTPESDTTAFDGNDVFDDVTVAFQAPQAETTTISLTCATGATNSASTNCTLPTNQTTQELTATVRNAAGAPLAGVAVRFALTVGGTDDPAGTNDTESLSQSQGLTDASGQVKVTVTDTVPTAGETLTVVATIVRTNGEVNATSVTTYRATAASDARRITISNPATATVGNVQPVVATVVDRFGNPVQGVEVTFTEEGTGRFVTGSSTFVATTNAQGRATAEVTTTSNEQPGSTTITATITSPRTNGANNDECEQAANASGGTANSAPGAPAGACSATTTVNFVAATAPPTTTPPTTTPPTSGAPANCTQVPTIVLERTTIIATGRANYRVTNAPANSTVEIFAYSNPNRTYAKVRTVSIGADGNGPGGDGFTPPTNTRLYAQVVGCDTDETRFSTVINVRTQISLNVVRNGTRNYTFSGRLLPARRGGLIASLYRVTNDGRQILTAQTRASETTGAYTINRRFSGTGRFGFVVRTGQDLQNAPGSSNVRSLLVF